MKKIDALLIQLLLWARKQPLLYRFTLGTRILLAVGFIPTGMVKVLGHRFTTLSTEHETGAFFEVLYQSGYYWQFLGAAQVMAGILILFERTAALGAVLFLGIIANIFFITISYDFSGTPFITFPMLMASFWLIFWDWHRIRPLFFLHAPAALDVPQSSLRNTFERAVYVIGLLSGLMVFSVMRGLAVPMPLFYAALSIAVFSFLLAFVLGIVYHKSKVQC
ncbi:MAG: hypothetical protein KF775_12765 [Cyclobacteriaceae bacterium]|nr:hypothetical protein [Cyclobacteriaceae bacterium]